MLKQLTLRDRKGISPIVATIAMVLLTIAAAGFIAGFVVPLVKERLNHGTECVGVEDYFKFYDGFDYGCYQKNGAEYIYFISVQAGSIADEKTSELAGMKFLFLAEGESKAVELKEGQLKTPDFRMLDSSKDVLVIPSQGDVRTYVYSSPTAYSSVEMHTLLKSGRVCETASDNLRIRDFACKPGLITDTSNG